MMENADYIVDLGPKAGRKGGEITAIGGYSDILKSDSLTAQYLKGEKVIAIPAERRAGNGKKISLKGCTGNNLKNVSVDFPLGKLICVTRGKWKWKIFFGQRDFASDIECLFL